MTRRRDPEYPHLSPVVRWQEHLPPGVVAECSADVAREAALAALFPDVEPVRWPWVREEAGPSVARSPRPGPFSAVTG